MGTVMPDPFRNLPVTCSEGPNQCQDPGLDEETRRKANLAVARAVNRSVFYLDEMLSQAETRLDWAIEAYKVYADSRALQNMNEMSCYVERYTEELLGRHG